MQFQIGHANEAEVENRGCQSSVRATRRKYFDEVFNGTRAAGSNHWDMRYGRNGSCEVHVEAVLGAITIHRCHEEFACARFLGLFRPFDCVFSCGIAAPGFLDFKVCAVVRATGVNRDYRSLGAELGGDLRN